MTRTTSEGRAFLAGIRQQPDEDTPRLAFADWLQENGDEARAELIRVQVELSNWRPYTPPEQVTVTLEDIRDYPTTTTGPVSQLKHERRHHHLQFRERELRAANADIWRKGPKCEKCTAECVRIDDGIYPCPDCWGTGDAGGLTREVHDGAGHIESGEKRYRHRVEYVRGMARVHCTSADVWEAESTELDLGRYGGTTGPDGIRRKWRPTAWALAVCRHHPDVCELWVTDCDECLTGDGKVWWWRGADAYPTRPRLPAEVRPWDEYTTADMARLWFARHLVQWVHSHAG